MLLTGQSSALKYNYNTTTTTCDHLQTAHEATHILTHLFAIIPIVKQLKYN